jgi:rhamnulokinase
MSRYLAFDLGAESGRAVVGQIDGGRLHLREIHRFANGAVRVLDNLHWDALRLWSEIKHGLALAARSAAEDGEPLASIGLDTWGIDFGLLAPDDSLLGNPFHYRDRRTEGMLAEALRRVPRAEIYRQTGVQFMEINSLYQLLAMARAGSPALAAARMLLNMPDLFNFWLCGVKASEFSIATTTQFYDPVAGDWAWDLLDRLGIPSHFLGAIVPTGTILGPLLPSVAAETGSDAVQVVAAAGHDTAAAVAAVPAAGEDWIYLSSGTWSLMGIESAQPIINERSLAYDFTNEGGVGGTIRFLKNIVGLWIVQECRREWERAGDALSYDDLTRLAAEAPAFGALVVPSNSRFVPPGDMPARIQAACAESGQRVPQTRGEIVRCALESLALEYRWVAERLDDMAGRRLPVVHIIGGGSRNRLLNQFTADATGRTVVAGPMEATAVGNVLVQALALGEIASLAEGRSLVARSFDVQTFHPGDTAAWDAAYERFLRLREGRA